MTIAGVFNGANDAFDKKRHTVNLNMTTILTAGLLGEQYIGLEAGGDEKMLQSGDAFAQTQSAVVLEKLIGQFMFNKASEGLDAK